MALVRNSADTLLRKAEAGELHKILEHQAEIQFNAKTGLSEITSWQNSLPAFLQDLHDAGLGQIEVLLEQKLPYSPKRVDVILCGATPKTEQYAYVLVELKQWTSAELRDDGLVVIPQYGQPVLHPVDQVRGYCEYLVDFVPFLTQVHAGVYGIAYLHNATADGWKLKRYRMDEHGRLYTRDERAELIDELRRLLDSSESSAHIARRAADDLLNARSTPTKQLLKVAAREVREREQFVLLDQQQVAYRMVEQAVDLANRENTKTAVIVLGGPGSGKSVLALSLLGGQARRGNHVLHATGSGSFTRTLRKIVGSRNTRAQGVFKYFNNFMAAEPNSLDLLICDEAHRIRETSVDRFTRADRRATARRQVQELIDVARTPVFLLDENQVVRPGEMGTEAEIREAAESAGCRVDVVRLEGQYRCGGSELYDQWVHRLLGLDPRNPVSWSQLTQDNDEDYRVATLPSPTALESWLTTRSSEAGGSARITAGFCWRWSDPVLREGAKVLVDDVVIGDWKRPWNAKGEAHQVHGVPASYYWASDERGFGQVGCIYTAQGFEYDWSAVIFGNDFVRRDGTWVTRREYSQDSVVKKATPEEFPCLIRNTYKVLLTRGMRATALYSVDEETQAFFEEMCR